MKQLNKTFYNYLFVCFFSIVLFASACKQAEIVPQTGSQLNIAGYIDQDPNFSEFRKIMELSGSSGFLQAYGAYTLFLPTNEAIKAYLQKMNVATVQELGTKEQLRDFVFFHIIADSLKTTDFSDGKLRNPTMFGQYIITGAVNNGGTSIITVNKQANLIEGNISLGNGIIHKIDKVLEPKTQTVAQLIDSNPDFTIFAKALKETGFYDRLNKTSKENPVFAEKFLTVFAESNAALAAAKFDTYEKLKARYSTKGDPTNPEDSLNIYVAYHIATSARYYPELVSTASASTLAVPTLTISTKENDEVVIDEIQVGDSLEVGAPVLRSKSDLSASNGVVHTVGTHFYIKPRTPQPVYYDIADQPEFRRLSQWKTGVRRYQSTDLPKIARIIMGENKYWIEYVGNDANAAGRDYLKLPVGNSSGQARNRFIDIVTPFVAKGTYRLWICYRKVTSATCQFYWNGKLLNRTLNFGTQSTPPAAMPEQEKEQAGFKQYTTAYSPWFGRSLGVVTVEKNGPQVFRIEAMAGSFRDDQWIDMLHIIPDGMDQLWPRFDVNGNKVNRPVTP